METLNTIETMRRKNGFLERNYPRYRSYLKTKMRQCTSGDIRRICKLESNVSKFFMFDSVRFLKKNLRILRGDTSEFSSIYTEFMTAMIGSATNNPTSLNFLLELRKRLLPFRSFVSVVELLIESPLYNFDLSSLKVKFLWNDIEMGFNTAAERDEFLENKVVPQGGGYDSTLGRHVLNIEKKTKQLFSLIESKPGKVVCIGKKIDRLLRTLGATEEFLRQNLVESEYISRTMRETQELKSYYSKVKDFVEFVRWDESMDAFSVPPMFGPLEPHILSAREDMSYVSKKHIRNGIVGYLERIFRPREPTINVPFVPVIFDVAADYINYPTEDKRMSELVKKIQVSK